MDVEYSFAHVGLHCDDEAECMAAVEKFRDAFGFPSRDVGNSVIVAGPMELTKMPVRGTAGHIAVACSDMAEAVRELQAKGFAIDETTLQQTPDRQIQSVYLQDTFGGFACHLIQKR
ncbi:MAG: VOC family protein [Lachnospiraceae bacterium]|nr:VOC family protein [Acetatifactor muris]MCM1219730.1 VOC family protein [Lachnospiraceae bacterium]